MPQCIIKQPNGYYAIFSTIVDNFTVVDCSRDDLIEEFMERERELITQKVDRILAALEAGEKPYNQFTMSWEEALETIREVHGTEEAERVAALPESAEQEQGDATE